MSPIRVICHSITITITIIIITITITIIIIIIIRISTLREGACVTRASVMSRLPQKRVHVGAHILYDPHNILYTILYYNRLYDTILY